ncbi:hypothetical protein TWF696_005108 [Orbilia brochopaga]|uniref:Uncharacterized protein n=1 Tax=Orbilia brochopaga TaxID=3140254 RepID=A0AAV9V020_9PEZI
MFRNVTNNRADGGVSARQQQRQQQPWSSSLDGSLRKRRAPYADSDPEDEDEESAALPGVKKQRMAYPSIDTAFISPPVTPTTLPMARRQNSDVAMEDLDMLMADSQPGTSSSSSSNSQTHHRWDSAAAAAGGRHVPAFVAQESNASAMSVLAGDDDDNVINRPHTPGMIMRDLTRLEVSPSSEIQSRGWSGMGGATKGGSMQTSCGGGGGKMATAASKGRFTMGYRADCEKCRSRMPGHWAHPPTM